MFYMIFLIYQSHTILLILDSAMLANKKFIATAPFQQKHQIISAQNTYYQQLLQQQQNQIDFLKRYNILSSITLGDSIDQQQQKSSLKDKNMQFIQPIRKISISISSNGTSKSIKSKLSTSKSKSKLLILTLKDFKIGKHIGSGRFSDVFIAKNIKTGFICALKRIKKAQVIQQNMLDQLIRQIKLQLFCDHPNLLKLYGIFHTEQFIFLITELCSEGELYNHIQKKNNQKKQGCFNDKEVAIFIKQIVQGVHYMHTLNIIHRDLKPQNILVQRNILKICDFGWAVHLKSDLRSTFCGSPLYVSPEILKGEKYDSKIDLWAIGIMAYQLFYGEIPFKINNQSDLYKIVNDQIKFPKTPEINPALKKFILNILHKNPKQRQSISALLQDPYLKNLP